jgi:hypothetical protein
MGRRLKIFLCYASEDFAKAKRLDRRLTNSGHEVWLDRRSLLGGDEWQLEIAKAVKETDIVLACLSTPPALRSRHPVADLRERSNR